MGLIGRQVGFVGGGGELTPYQTGELEGKRFVSVVDKFEIIPSCLSSFLVKARKYGELTLDYSEDLDNPKSRVLVATLAT